MTFLHVGLLVGVMALSVCCAEEAQSSRAAAKDYEIVFELGSAEDLIALYSYPNSEDSSQTLEQTVEHYLIQCVERDLVINGTADVFVVGDTYHVTISGDSKHVDDYNETINISLRMGSWRLKLSAI